MFRQSRPFSYSPRSVWHFIVRYFTITSALLNVLMMMIIDDVANPLLSSFCCVFFFSFRGFSQDNFPQARRPFQQDDFRGSPVQRNGMFRPSGKSIYSMSKL